MRRRFERTTGIVLWEVTQKQSGHESSCARSQVVSMARYRYSKKAGGYKKKRSYRKRYATRRTRTYSTPKIAYKGKTNFKPTMAFAKLVVKAMEKKKAMTPEKFRQTHTKLFNTNGGYFKWFKMRKGMELAQQPGSPWQFAAQTDGEPGQMSVYRADVSGPMPNARDYAGMDYRGEDGYAYGDYMDDDE